MKRSSENILFYGVAGSPILHSKSPQLFSLFSRERASLGHYGRFLIKTEEELRYLLSHFPLQGLNITSPLKEKALGCADTCEKEAKIIGAANLLVREEKGWRAYNTDYTALRLLIGKTGISAGSSVLIAGAGGAARAAALAARDLNFSVTLTNRTEENGSRTASELGIRFQPWDESRKAFPLMITALPGQADALSDHKEFDGIIIDAAYPSSKTTREASKRGLYVLSGEEWLIEQGKASYAIMTGFQPSEKDISSGRLKSISLPGLPVILCGFMGSGKTATGYHLKKKGMSLYSTDNELSKRAGSSVHDAFRNRGERDFRRMEAEIVGEGALFGFDVIDSGGGLWMDSDLQNMIPAGVSVFFLWNTPEKAAERGRNRPLIQGKSIDSVKKRYEERLPVYFSLSDAVLLSDLLHPDEMARRIDSEMKTIQKLIDS